ncbi:hypothetical protein CEUSTIGMA_g9086.t1 [Chlamydomonas eustigma]|uniref:Methyltransferase FkbM domain-containing protein n=1 Tax=Chlamydomonas eustigma TaxID=1157962 RepID=A0A250XF00_9CHLO|nr:hypothetical protein CEUSTIGMA_g9086.t1 [Chlamydomonas eustigma]|eukprot:GAX81658.1 hypothetical protein CEUSTIGMA_g9086.t1 [Chlamydomonas eustigma]
MPSFRRNLRQFLALAFLLFTVIRSSSARYVCQLGSNGQPLSCASDNQPDLIQLPQALASTSASLMGHCLWDLMPFPFATSSVNLTIQVSSPTAFQKGCSDAWCTTTVNWRAVMHHPENDMYISSSLFYQQGGHGWENALKAMLFRFLKTQPPEVKALVLDVGANIGIHSLWFAALGHETHCFEPLKQNFALLHCSVINNPYLQPNIHLNNFGLGLRNKTVCMSVNSDVNNMGGTRVMVSRVNQGQQVSEPSCSPELESSMRTLDWYWRSVLNKRPVFMMKVDVEGYEPYVVMGGAAMFRESPPKVLMLEFTPNLIREAGGNPERFLQTLEGFGYALCGGNPVCERLTSAARNETADYLLVYQSLMTDLSLTLQ